MLLVGTGCIDFNVTISRMSSAKLDQIYALITRPSEQSDTPASKSLIYKNKRKYEKDDNDCLKKKFRRVSRSRRKIPWYLMELYIRTVGRIQDTLYAALKNLVCSLLYIQKNSPACCHASGRSIVARLFRVSVSRNKLTTSWSI